MNLPCIHTKMVHMGSFVVNALDSKPSWESIGVRLRHLTQFNSCSSAASYV